MPQEYQAPQALQVPQEYKGRPDLQCLGHRELLVRRDLVGLQELAEPLVLLVQQEYKELQEPRYQERQVRQVRLVQQD